MAIYNFTPSVKLLIHVVHIEGWFCHLCLCYKNKYSVHSFVNESLLQPKGRCKNSALTGKITTVYFWSLILRGFLPCFLKILISFSWNFFLQKYAESITHFFLFTNFCTRLLTSPDQTASNRWQVEKKKCLFLSCQCIPQIWGLLGSLTPGQLCMALGETGCWGLIGGL